MKKYMVKKMTGKLHLFLFAGLCFTWSLLLTPDMLLAKSPITARYVVSSGSELLIEINAGAQPPASLILIQHFPPGTRMLNSQPGASNYNAEQNMAKWLFRNLRPGTATVKVTLDRTVETNEISAEIRFKPPDGGKMETIVVDK